MSDVAMKPLDEKEEKNVDETKDKKVEEVKKQPPSVPAEIKANVLLIDRAVSTLEPRYTLRVLRTLATLRKRLTNQNLVEAIEVVFPTSTFTSLR